MASDCIEGKNSIKAKLDAFQIFVSTNKYSKNTKDNYINYAKHMLGECGGCRDNPKKQPHQFCNCIEVCQNHINAFLDSFNHNVARSFIRTYCYEFLQASRDKIKIPKLRGRAARKLPKYLTTDEIKVLKEHSPNWLQIMLDMLFETGMRISEAIAVTPNNINHDNRTIRGIGKGNKEFIVNLTEKTYNNLAAYIKIENISQTGRVFPFNRNFMWKIMHEVGKKALNKKVTPHMLRHSLGHHMRASGVDLLDIKDYMRHENIQTTAIYSKTARVNVEKKWKEVFEDNK